MGKRRSNGEGSIYQRKDGRWVAALTIEGRTRPVTRYCKSLQEARAALKDLVAKRDRGIDLVAANQTVEQFLLYWLENVVKPNRAYGTLRSYQAEVTKQIVPAIGHVHLQKLTRQQVQSVVDRRVRAGYADSTIRLTARVMHNAFEQACAWDLLTTNPANRLMFGRSHRPKRRAFTREQAAEFLEAIKGNRLEALFTVALGLGLRRGEAAGLRWEDVELDKGILHVRHSLQQQRGEPVLTRPKTEGSVASLVLPPTLVTALRRHRVRQLEERARQGPKWQDTGFVFTTVEGKPMWPTAIDYRFKLLLREAGLPDMRLHDLRRSCGTLLLAQGVPLDVIKKILRHSSIRVTSDIYLDVVDELQYEAAAAMDRILSGTSGR